MESRMADAQEREQATEKQKAKRKATDTCLKLCRFLGLQNNRDIREMNIQARLTRPDLYWYKVLSYGAWLSYRPFSHSSSIYFSHLRKRKPSNVTEKLLVFTGETIYILVSDKQICKWMQFKERKILILTSGIPSILVSRVIMISLSPGLNSRIPVLP